MIVNDGQFEPIQETPVSSSEPQKSSKNNNCQKCDWKLTALTELMRHIEKSKKFDKPKKCADCNFSSCTGLRNHKCLKSQEKNPENMKKNVSCLICDQTFYSNKDLKIHRNTTEKLNHCSQCSFKSCTFRGMANHLKKSHGFFQKYKCLRCDVVSNDKQKFKKHEKISKNITKLKDCDYCNFKSCTSRALVHHKCLKLNSQLHSKNNLSFDSEPISLQQKNENPEIPMEKPKNLLKKFKCPKCDWRFSELNRLKRHMEKSKLYDQPCHLCNFLPCTAKSLSRHKCQKSQEAKVHSCQNCDMKFEWPKALQKHNETTKKLNKPKKCDQCNFTSCTSFGINRHFLREHPNLQHTSRKVDTPEKISFPENYLKLSVFDNEFKCAKCGMAFYFQKGYQKHIESVESPSVCNHCNFTSCTSLGLRRHENMGHEGLKLSAHLPQSEPTLATERPNFKPSEDQKSQSVQKPPVKYVLPKPKKGQWIVVLEKLDASDKDFSVNNTSNLEESFQAESKLNEIFELDTSMPNNNFEEIVIKEEWDEHEEMDSVIDMKI